MVRSPDGDTDFFDIIARVWLEDLLAPYLLIICQDSILQASIDLIKENGFMLKSLEEDDILLKLLQTQTMQIILHFCKYACQS